MSALPQSDAARGDSDQQETREWLDALAAVIATEGKDRAHFLRRKIDRMNRAGRGDQSKSNEATPHSTGMLSAMRAPSMSNRNCHTPGMWNISPVA